jgi:hypothetical protein
MPAHAHEVVKKFCELCNWLIQTWQMRKFLSDDNPQVEALKEPRHAHFFYGLQETLQESWLHQLAKLHDPAVQGGQKGHINLFYFVHREYGNWDTGTKAALVDLQPKIEVLAKPVRDARNKILSHNELAILLASRELGSFECGEDERYFDILKSFSSLVSQQVLGEPFIYDDLVKNDVDVFLTDFLRGVPK